MKGGLVLTMMLSSTPAWSECRQALALGLDVSGSVDAGEFEQQVSGLSDALGREPVRRALFAMPGTWVDLAVFLWSGPSDRTLILDWTPLKDEASLSAARTRIAGASRPGGDPSTALGSAMRAGAALLSDRDCWRHVLDLSGDGVSNTGPRPRGLALDPGVTVNGLVIGQTDRAAGDRIGGLAELSAYFRAEVLRGPDAFVETALGYGDFADAMERKLIRELRVLAIGETRRHP